MILLILPSIVIPSELYIHTISMMDGSNLHAMLPVHYMLKALFLAGKFFACCIAIVCSTKLILVS